MLQDGPKPAKRQTDKRLSQPRKKARVFWLAETDQPNGKRLLVEKAQVSNRNSRNIKLLAVTTKNRITVICLSIQNQSSCIYFFYLKF